MKLQDTRSLNIFGLNDSLSLGFGFSLTALNFLINLPLTTTIGDSSFSRASTGTIVDFEGLIKTVKSEEVRYEGVRRVENLYTSSTTLSTQGTTTIAGDYTVSFSGSGTITFSGTYSGSLVGDGINRKSITFTTTAGTLTSTVTGTVTDAQNEDVTGQANQNPSEYVSTNVLSTPYHGANVDGVQYFDYENGNTVDGSNIVAEAVGTDINSSVKQGVLIEEQSTNLLTYSEEFDDAVWNKLGVTVSTNSIVAPNGTITADKLIEDTGTTVHKIDQINKIVDELTTSQVSIYAKANGRSHIIISCEWGVNYLYGVFDILNGTVTEQGFGGTGVINNVLIKPFNNGFFQCILDGKIGTSGSDASLVLLSNTGTPGTKAPSYTGDGTSGVYLWGGEIKQENISTSYIKTTTASVTRLADQLTHDSFPTKDMVVAMTIKPVGDFGDLATTDIRLFGTDDSAGTVDEIKVIGHASTYSYTQETGGGVFAISQADFLKDVTYKVAFSLRQNGTNIDYRVYVDGVQELTGSTAGTLNHTDTGDIEIGAYAGTYCYTNIKDLKVFKTRSDAQLITLTT